MIQDLQAINKPMILIYPIVPNPYTLLSQVLHEAKWFMVLDLKGAFLFFCIPLHLDSQHLFDFEWTNPDTYLFCRCQDLSSFS